MMSVNYSYALFPSEFSRYLTAQLEVNICGYDLFFSEDVISTDIIVRDILSNRSPTFDCCMMVHLQRLLYLLRVIIDIK